MKNELRQRHCKLAGSTKSSVIQSLKILEFYFTVKLIIIKNIDPQKIVEGGKLIIFNAFKWKYFLREIN